MNLENCEFDDFCVSSWLIANLRFVDCSFNENLQFTNCQITNIELNHNIIRESFSLENISQTNTSLTICFTRIERAIHIMGKFHQIDLTNISTAKLNFSSLKIQGATNFLKVANDNEEPQIQGYENQIQQFSIRQSEIGAKVDFEIENMSCEDIGIKHCIFRRNIYFPKICKKINIRESEFEKNVYFGDVYFDEVGFYQNTFKDEVDFRTCQFENNASFSRNIFKHNVYFNNSIFKNYADFHGCEFEKGASFYGVSFEKTPNFSQALFKGNLNLVNTNLNFDFADLKSKIQEEYNNSIDTEQKSLESFTNDFRDSFRNFKSTLIANHNTLDALNFHKAELYCKEIELRQKWDKKGIEAKNEADMRKNILKFKECVDYLLLCFYRKLCEHHTDFLRVFNNLILLIALYALFAYLGNFDELVNENNSLKKYLDIFLSLQTWLNDNVCMPFILSIFFILSVIVCIEKILNFVKNFLKQLFSISLIIDIKNMAMICLFILLMSYFCSSLIKEDIIFINLAFFLFFILSYLWLLSLNNTLLRYFLIIGAYLLVLINIGFNKIVFLLPIIGKFVSGGNNSKEFIPTVTLAYTILMILVLFSLQKTARKNSIVPS